MGPGPAAIIVHRILGSYPHLNLHDPETYVTSLTAAFSEFPPWAGEGAALAVRKACPEFPPTEGRVRNELDEQMRAARYAAQYEREGQLQLTDRASEHRAQAARLPWSRHPLLVRPGRPGYEDMVERSRSAEAGEFAMTDQGIEVPVDWYLNRGMARK